MTEAPLIDPNSTSGLILLIGTAVAIGRQIVLLGRDAFSWWRARKSSAVGLERRSKPDPPSK